MGSNNNNTDWYNNNNGWYRDSLWGDGSSVGSNSRNMNYNNAHRSYDTEDRRLGDLLYENMSLADKISGVLLALLVLLGIILITLGIPRLIWGHNLTNYRVSLVGLPIAPELEVYYLRDEDNDWVDEEGDIITKSYAYYFSYGGGLQKVYYDGIILMDRNNILLSKTVGDEPDRIKYWGNKAQYCLDAYTRKGVNDNELWELSNLPMVVEYDGNLYKYNPNKDVLNTFKDHIVGKTMTFNTFNEYLSNTTSLRLKIAQREALLTLLWKCWLLILIAWIIDVRFF